MQCGLLGRKLGHSYSPQIHKNLGNYKYDLFEVEPENLDAFFKAADFTGINITMPYKKEVIKYCYELSDCAKKLGAVNTIVKKPNGQLIGHNTDYFGFSSMLKRTRLSVTGKKVLVLGSGGASATVVAVLEEAGAIPVIISRTGENNYTNISNHCDARIIVNTTPVGMYPNVDCSPLDLQAFPQLEGVLDVVYNPAHTKLLQQAEELGLVTENGLWMLVSQAKESAEWFTGSAIKDDTIAQVHKQLRLQMANIVLIGMPGCGKSTIGQILANKLNKKFVDADAEIAKAAGMSIPEIFEKYDEAFFRKIETQVLTELCAHSGLVIATGGGCVTRPENYQSLHYNGIIVWIRRDTKQLATNGRPLSQPEKLADMYAMRKPLYEKFADIPVDNTDSPEITVDLIISQLDQEI